MSYELRVPLHAVIGFAELFKREHNREDEPIFAREIKKNTDILLNLINDILFISRLDAHMIEYHYEECDFASLNIIMRSATLHRYSKDGARWDGAMQART